MMHVSGPGTFCLSLTIAIDRPSDCVMMAAAVAAALRKHIALIESVDGDVGAQGTQVPEGMVLHTVITWNAVIVPK